jgi:N-succinyldiaminopimelate aminotransferase
MNPGLAKLGRYPFERLAALKAGLAPPASLAHIALSIGEPRHAPPAFIREALAGALDRLDSYPLAPGMAVLREAIAAWLERRYRLERGAVDPERMILPLNGTREGLFAFAQAVIARQDRPLVMMPNPFYAIYEGAALLAGGEPRYLNCDEEHGFRPDLDAVPAADWRRCGLMYLCSPANPTGAVLDLSYLKRVLELASQHGFVVASDECYADIYFDSEVPPVGLLEAARACGHEGFERCVVFHSLSKRSSVPGLRSGFAAGDPAIMREFLRYRTYHGCAMPAHTQIASVAAWNDDAHAAANRRLYTEKFRRVLSILAPAMDVTRPEAAFYLWPRIDGDAEEFTRRLFAEKNVTVLPGPYLSRATPSGDPGAGRLRISLVAGADECNQAAARIVDFLRGWRRSAA